MKNLAKILGKKFYVFTAVLLVVVAGAGLLIYRLSKFQPITATFDYVDTDSNNNIEFIYTLTNNTRKNYEIDSLKDVQIVANIKNADTKDTVTSLGGALIFDTPLFVPAHQSTEFVLGAPSVGNYSDDGLNYASPYDATANAPDASSGDLATYRNDVANYLIKTAPDLNGFTIFDTKENYKINLLPDWITTTQTATPSVGVSQATSQVVASTQSQATAGTSPSWHTVTTISNSAYTPVTITGNKWRIVYSCSVYNSSNLAVTSTTNNLYISVLTPASPLDSGTIKHFFAPTENCPTSGTYNLSQAGSYTLAVLASGTSTTDTNYSVEVDDYY